MADWPQTTGFDLSKAVAELQRQAQEQADEKEVKARTELLTKAFDRSTAYSNVILVAGYAGIFTIWSFTKSQLPDRAMIAIALSLLISLAAFVVFEIVKMLLTTRAVVAPLRVFRGPATAAEKMEAVKQIDSASAKIMAAFWYYWAATMIVSVLGALIALSLLTYNFVAVLLRWPGWPA
ncbi:hypothetical protein [Methylorubrum thiocyanatum]|uniref:hypothetical protein n=1 Tax=Methylorubrum thiocyanatum TaxID=47958 RepID=UPI00398C5ECC